MRPRRAEGHTCCYCYYSIYGINFGICDRIRWMYIPLTQKHGPRKKCVSIKVLNLSSYGKKHHFIHENFYFWQLTSMMNSKNMIKSFHALRHEKYVINTNIGMDLQQRTFYCLQYFLHTHHITATYSSYGLIKIYDLYCTFIMVAYLFKERPSCPICTTEFSLWYNKKLSQENFTASIIY